MAITAKLIGGLGNQLFGYFAGTYLADKLQTELILDLHQQRNNQHVGSSILDFKLDNRVLYGAPLRSFVEKVLNLSPRRILDLDDVARALLKVHVSRSIGFDPKLDLVRDGSYISGYFQTYRYFFDNPKSTVSSPLELANPSPWLQRMMGQAAEVRPTVLHVRRGDYSKPINNSMGLLSPSFFLSALEELEHKLRRPHREVWVFSDSITQVREEFGSAGKNFRFIEAPEAVSAAENLVLMASGVSLVISNSTFSYWAGLMGHVPAVVAPLKWFRDLEDPVDLVPPNWHRTESEWI